MATWGPDPDYWRGADEWIRSATSSKYMEVSEEQRKLEIDEMNMNSELKYEESKDETLLQEMIQKGYYFVCEGRRYFGEFSPDQRSGKGICVVGNGDRYEGKFKQGRINIGIHVKSDGESYAGAFHNEQWTGFGIYSVKGMTYQGNFENGQIVDMVFMCWPMVTVAKVNFVTV